MNVLVLGGQGFIGSHIVDSLLNEGHQVRVLALQENKMQSNVECIIGDFLDKEQLSESLYDIDTVIHCISTTVPATSASDPVYDIQSNLVGTVELLKLMQENKVSRLVYFSSGGTVYGNPLQNPVSESAFLDPISSYGAVKVAIEKFIMVSKANWGIKPVILRPSNPFGEGQTTSGLQGLISTVLNNIINKQKIVIYGDGSAVRDYIYVKDVADLVVSTLRTDHCGIYNVGSGSGLSINEVINITEKITGIIVEKEYKEMRGFDVKEIVLDCSLAKKDFGWHATESFESGIKKQFEWLKKIYDSANK